MKHLILPVTLLSLTLTAMSAQAGEVQPRRQISVEGQASRLVEPDEARLHLTVHGRAAAPGEASVAAGEISAAVVKTLSEFVAKADIRATQTQLRSVVKGTERNWRQDAGEPMEMLASRDITVERIPAARLPDVMTALARHKLARINDVALSVSQADAIEDELLLAATDDAKARAERIAARLGVALGLPISVQVQRQFAAQPKMMVRAMSMEMADAGGGYDATGQNRIEARVHISFELTAE